MIRRVIDSLVISISRFSLYEEMSFYAVAKGKKVGIYNSWAECQSQTNGYPGAKYKKFSSEQEAQSFIDCGYVPEILPVMPKVTQPSNSLESLQKFEISGAKTRPTLGASSSGSQSNGSYYAVAIGKNVGIYFTWLECKSQIDGCGFTRYKKFDNLEEAERFIQENKIQKGPGPSKVSQSQKSLLSNFPAVATDKDISVRKLSTVSFRDHAFQQDEEGFVHCYTDGSCEKNGQVGAKAGVGVWFGVDHALNVSEPVEGPPTNNVAEIQAATKAILVARQCGIQKLQINTDSQFLIKCITQWMPKWQKNGWKISTGGDVKNKEQLEELHRALKNNVEIKWNYVKAHKGIEGNEHADLLAKAGAANYKMKTTTRDVRFKPYSLT
ncbi:ribonuclease H1 isoform X1 [Daphnia magna]|uniref:ribonuclease H1 isoform X1 n=2 Tax=Daphnia magna TaxID=35525 RepID=UPI001E1BA6CE|nr:ribonuclease H1 isoform X1 [Daphnia magna]